MAKQITLLKHVKQIVKFARFIIIRVTRVVMVFRAIRVIIYIYQDPFSGSSLRLRLPELVGDADTLSQLLGLLRLLRILGLLNVLRLLSL